MNATLPNPNFVAVLKAGAILLVGWFLLWLITAVLFVFAFCNYEGIGFIWLGGYYGLVGGVHFSVLGALHYRHRVCSWWRSILSALFAGLLAFLLVPDLFFPWQEDVRVWVVVIMFAKYF